MYIEQALSFKGQEKVEAMIQSINFMTNCYILQSNISAPYVCKVSYETTSHICIEKQPEKWNKNRRKFWSSCQTIFNNFVI